VRFLSDKEKLIINIQLLVIGGINAIFAGIVMNMLINKITNGNIVPLDSFIHILTFLAILIPSVIFGYMMWGLFNTLSLFIILEIDRVLNG
jgi:hypothetical protein